MSLDVDQYEIELLVEAIQYRIENDETFLLNHCLKQELEDLLGKIQDESTYDVLFATIRS